jgi:hypothetical protein
LPQLSRHRGRIDLDLVPPGSFIAASVELAMMDAAQWDGELIADLASERARLRESEMMGILGAPPADEARLQRHELAVSLIAFARLFRECQTGGVAIGVGWR